MENCCSNEELKQYADSVDMSIFNQGPAVVFHWRNEEHWPVEFVTPNTVLVFGYSAADFFEGRIHYAAIIHPDDLERVTAEVVHFSESGAKQFQHEDYRIVAKDGTVRWVEDHTQIIRDDTGQLTHYLGYVLDVSARKDIEEQLIQAKFAAENASQAKSEFLSRMSHELRTPMNAILGFTELMMDVDEDPLTKNQRESLGIIQGAGQHLLDLINEVLDLAKIDEGKLQLACEDVDWRRVIKQSVELTRPSLDKQGLSLVEEISSVGPVMVKADEVRLRQVLLNLLSNAVKYNRPQGSIILRSTVADTGTLRIEVTDTGQGLTEAQIGELFEPFNRLSNERVVTEGVGIGLVISERLMDLMGGTIGVQCVPGGGCTFWLELPAVPE